jgi:hypothetical protein
MADGPEVPLGILKEEISRGEFLPESCCRSNIGESEGSGGIGGVIIGIYADCRSVKPLGAPRADGPAETHQGLTLLIY